LPFLQYREDEKWAVEDSCASASIDDQSPNEIAGLSCLTKIGKAIWRSLYVHILWEEAKTSFLYLFSTTAICKLKGNL
jgi:hypothetical protein